MSLTTKNKRIIQFFHERPNMDFETMMLKFIDIMEALHANMNSSLNNTMVSQILENLKTMQEKIETVSTNVNKIQSDTQIHFSLKMTEFKKEYIEDLKMILSCNVSERIEPMLKEQNAMLFEKTATMMSSVIPKSDEVMSKNLESIIKRTVI